jgi:hypothetical protein
MRAHCSFQMTQPEILREQAHILRNLAARQHAKHFKELLLHLAEQCEQLAQRGETDFASKDA